jgi:HD-GYP domain-containing protein (c-di-GMP phosphodiesterase class II)
VRTTIAPFAAAQELLRSVGTQFDPDVVDALTTTLGVRRAGRSRTRPKTAIGDPVR